MSVGNRIGIGRSQVLRWLDARFRTTPTISIFAYGLVLAASIGSIDYATGPELSFSIFYLIPITFVTWFAGQQPGLLTSVLCAIIWLIIDLEVEHTHPFFHYWNAAVRCGFFFIVTRLLALVTREYRRQRDLAHLDPLTGIPNLRAFSAATRDALDQTSSRELPFTIAYVDIDDFKSVNDRLGHPGGDAVLRTVAVTLRAAVREHDFVARLGGDEFGVLLTNASAETAKLLLERLANELQRATAGAKAAVTVTMGATTFLRPPASPADALASADALMYEVKRAGKGAIRHALVDGNRRRTD